ncbi:MAG: DMT family transporter [Anaerolineales bacterium]|nr:DMT family transporter [Anaerolineales bacterium]
MDKKPAIPPLPGLFFGLLAVSTASVFIRYAQQEAPSLVIAASRLTIASLVLAPIVLKWRRAELRRLSAGDLRLALLSGFFLALHFATWISSLEYTTVASSVVLVTTTPLWVALLAPLTLKESISRLVLIGMALALAGGVVVGMSDACLLQAGRLVCPSAAEFFQGQAFLGDLLALAGALMAACYIIIGRRLRARVSLLSYIFVVYGMAAVVLVVIMLGAGQTPLGYSGMTYIWFILLALVPQLLGHSSFNWALGYLSAAYVSIALLGEPIGSTILAYIFLDEAPTAIKIFGAILILSGIYIASRSEASPRNGEAMESAET